MRRPREEPRDHGHLALPAGAAGATGTAAEEFGDRGYYFWRWMAARALDLLVRPRYRCPHRVPAEGAVILASTHQSFLDPCLVGCGIERRSWYLARASLFKVPVFGRLIRRLGAFPVPRESMAPRKALELALSLLAMGRPLVVFPEGTRTRDGKLQPLKGGVYLMARRSGAAVVPVLIHGAHEAWPRGKWLPRPGRVSVQYGDAIRLEEGESAEEFLGRLQDAYRWLALEAGAREVLPGPVLSVGSPVTEARGSVPSSSFFPGVRGEARGSSMGLSLAR